MSVDAIRAAFERSGATRLRLSVLLALAEFVSPARDEDQWEAWISQAQLAEQLNCDPRKVREALARLVFDGELEPLYRRRSGVQVYRLVLPDEKPSRADIAQRDRRAREQMREAPKRPKSAGKSGRYQQAERPTPAGKSGRDRPTRGFLEVSEREKRGVGPCGPTSLSSEKIKENGGVPTVAELRGTEGNGRGGDADVEAVALALLARSGSGT